MEILLTNTLTRTKQPFSPIYKGKVGMYSCGPTVYDHASIGNHRAFLFADLLKRMFVYNGYEVKHVMNITDVGHLVSDNDDGEDKLEKKAKETSSDVWEISRKYTEEFIGDLERLNIIKPTVMPKATEHIDAQIKLIEELERRGFTYQISDGVYFDTAKLPSYGTLSGQKLEEKEEGARVAVNKEKRNPTDFALWKFAAEDEKRQMEWDSPWGIGFPGWHIECSAMSEQYLDSPFDIHTGGIDHIPVHHTNEIAQTEGARGHQLANYWLHNEFLLVDGGKMSKSLGNTYTISDLKDKGYDPLAYRYFILGAHYRSPQNFTYEALDAAQNALRKLRSILRAWDHPSEPDASVLEAFLKAINDDLNMPAALAELWKMVDSDLETSIKAATIVEMDRVFGLKLEAYINAPLELPMQVQMLLRDRLDARKAGDYEKSDDLRDAIADLGFVVEDTKSGQEVREK